MAFWSTVRTAVNAIVTANDNGPLRYRPGDPNGLEFEPGGEIEQRTMPVPGATPWDGWPSGWQPPQWNKGPSQGFADGSDNLVDIAWQCVDMNANIVSAMPVYQTSGTQIIGPASWMANPDPEVYSSWQEFAKQMFWDYQLGEVFILASSRFYDNTVRTFRVIPPWMVKVEMRGGIREYFIGETPVSDRILHIRYSSSTAMSRGKGPLEMANAKLTQIKLLQRYVTTLAETGGVPLYWIGVNRRLTKTEARDLQEQWIETRTANPGQPGILGSQATLNQARTMDAKEMGLLEISQFSESRIAGMLGVPPFLVGLAGASGSLTYSNITDLFDFHDRSSLRPKTLTCFEALSAWALPAGRGVEVNRDDYTRLPFDKRMQAYALAIDKRILTPEEVRQMERYQSAQSSAALTGAVDQ